MREFQVCVLTATLVACTSCGTFASRSPVEFGAYPLMAGWSDLKLMQIGLGGDKGTEAEGIPRVLFLLGGLLSFPLDLAIDVVVLPVDLGAWAFGIYKAPSHDSQ